MLWRHPCACGVCRDNVAIDFGLRSYPLGLDPVMVDHGSPSLHLRASAWPPMAAHSGRCGFDIGTPIVHWWGGEDDCAILVIDLVGLSL